MLENVIRELDAGYWENRYSRHDHPWDLGRPSSPLKEYLNSIDDKSSRILIPGSGCAYEAAYGFRKGMQNIHVLDWSETALSKFRFWSPDFPESNIHQGDFFLHDGKYDLILEQNFFCAIPPSLRMLYVDKMWNLLEPGGLLCGVLFNFPFDPADGPPWGGDDAIYRELFRQKFRTIVIEPCRNSEPERLGMELFFCLKRTNV